MPAVELADSPQGQEAPAEAVEHVVQDDVRVGGILPVLVHRPAEGQRLFQVFMDFQPRETMVVDISSRNAPSSSAGAAKASGLLPYITCRPKVGTPSAPVLLMVMPIMSCGSAMAA